MPYVPVEIKVSLDSEFSKIIKWLGEYKAAADEALSYCLETSIDEKQTALCLKALNIGARKDTGNGE